MSRSPFVHARARRVHSLADVVTPEAPPSADPPAPAPPSLFGEQLTPEQHGALDLGHAAARSAAENADAAYLFHAKWLIKTMMPGRKFLAEDVAEELARGNYRTSDARALGHVIREAKAEKLIASTGETRPAKSSHGSPKTLWMRL